MRILLWQLVILVLNVAMKATSFLLDESHQKDVEIDSCNISKSISHIFIRFPLSFNI